MKLGVSNLAWPAEATGAALSTLPSLGVVGLEVAPTRIADWGALTSAALTGYRSRVEAAGLRVCSLQAIFFGRPQAQLLGDAGGFAEMADHLKRVSEIGHGLGAGVAVFGAPRNRAKGSLSGREAQCLAAERLRILGSICAPAGLRLVLEPIPERYGADFLLHAAEVRDVVALCGHESIGAHLDTACVTLAGDSIGDEIGRTLPNLCHFHAAEPDIGPFDSPICHHEAAAAALRSGGYDRWVVLEMREQPGGLLAVEEAACFVSALYSQNSTLPPHRRAQPQP